MKKKENLFTYIKKAGETMEIIILILVFITIVSIEVQLRKLNKTNQEIVKVLKEIKNKE